MRILYLEWAAMGNEFMQAAMKKKGYEVKILAFDQKTEDTRYGYELAERIAKTVMEAPAEYAFAFSFNFFPTIAVACKACRIPYVSWTYDSPFIQLYSETARYETNRIFHFDSYEVEKLKANGVENVWYLPMAAPVAHYDGMDFEKLSAKERAYYTSDVSFVGSTYTEKKQQLYSRFDNLDPYTKGYVDSIVNAQQRVYGYNFLEEVLTPEIVSKLQKVAPWEVHKDGFETVEWVYADYFLSRMIAAKERREILKMLGETFVKNADPAYPKAVVKLFTHEKTPELENAGVKNMGRIDYLNQMPYAFKGAKINLNISLRSIRAGIPLRCMDIMGCGGFLLTNYQPDFMRHFTPDEDFVFFESMQDLKEKVAYYLTHEDARTAIAESGYRKVKEVHTFEARLGEMEERIR